MCSGSSVTGRLFLFLVFLPYFDIVKAEGDAVLVFKEVPKWCPRCLGSMIPERDDFSEYAYCLACGYHHEPTMISSEELGEERRLRAGKKRRRHPSHGKIRL